MKIPPSLLVASLLASVASLAHGAPFYGWTEDYTGNEANTIALWKFDTAGGGVGSNSYTGSDYIKSGLSFSGTNTLTGDGITGKFGQALSIAVRDTSNSDAATPWAYSNSGSVTGDPAVQTLFNGSAMSVEFWYQPIASSLGNNGSYLFDQKNTDHTGVALTLRNTTGPDAINDFLRFSVGNGLASATLDTGSLAWNLDTWYHIEVTFENVEGDGVLKIYRDGVLLADTTVADFGDAAPGTDRYRIGNRRASTYSSAPGFYDNFRISNVAYEYAAIPEPGTVGLLSAPLIFLAVRQLRRKSAHA